MERDLIKIGYFGGKGLVLVVEVVVVAVVVVVVGLNSPKATVTKFIVSCPLSAEF